MINTRIQKYKQKRDEIYHMCSEYDNKVAKHVQDLNIIDPDIFKNYQVKTSEIELKNIGRAKSHTTKSNLTNILKEIKINSFQWQDHDHNYSRIYLKNKKYYQSNEKNKDIFKRNSLVISIFIVIILISVIVILQWR